MGGPENGNFPLLYVVKMALRGWVVQKSLKTPLRNTKMAPIIEKDKKCGTLFPHMIFDFVSKEDF